MSDKLWINDVLVNETGAESASPAGHGVIQAVELDFGTPNQETFLDPRSMAPGVRFNGTVTKDRPFSMRLIVTGVGGLAEGQDEWEEIIGVLTNVLQGPISIKSERQNAAAGTVTRELLAILTGEPAWAPVKIGDGIWPNGTIVIGLEFIAPFPWWRDAAATTETIEFTGTAEGEIEIERPGHVACGAEIKVTTAGALASLAVSDGTYTMTMTASFDADPLGVDWRYADPGATSIDAGVVIGDTSHFELHSETTTVTAVPPGTATGAHVVTIKYKALWKTP